MRLQQALILAALSSASACSGSGDDGGESCETSSVAVDNSSGNSVQFRIDGGAPVTVPNGESHIFENLDAPEGHIAYALLINVPNGYCGGDWGNEHGLSFELGCQRETFICE